MYAAQVFSRVRLYYTVAATATYDLFRLSKLKRICVIRHMTI